jgi:hypothetical protein
LSPFNTLGPIAFEPAEHGGLTLADNGGNLWDLEPLFRREEDQRRAGPQPRIFGGAIQVLEFFGLSGGQSWSLAGLPVSSLPSFVETFVGVLSDMYLRMDLRPPMVPRTQRWWAEGNSRSDPEAVRRRIKNALRDQTVP